MLGHYIDTNQTHQTVNLIRDCQLTLADNSVDSVVLINKIKKCDSLGGPEESTKITVNINLFFLSRMMLEMSSGLSTCSDLTDNGNEIFA